MAVIGVVVATGGGSDGEIPQAGVPPTSPLVPVPSPISPTANTIPLPAINPALTTAVAATATAAPTAPAVFTLAPPQTAIPAPILATNPPLRPTTPIFRRTPTPTLPPLAPGAGLSRGGSISGVVTDAKTGLPIRGVFIRASNLQENAPGFGDRTDGMGIYMIQSVTPGRYKLRPTSRTSDYVAEIYNDSLDWNNGADLVTVDGSERVEGIDFALSPGASISGTVTGAETGRPSSVSKSEPGRQKAGIGSHRPIPTAAAGICCAASPKVRLKLFSAVEVAISKGGS